MTQAGGDCGCSGGKLFGGGGLRKTRRAAKKGKRVSRTLRRK